MLDTRTPRLKETIELAMSHNTGWCSIAVSSSLECVQNEEEKWPRKILRFQDAGTAGLAVTWLGNY
jgi:hypothetical protein